MTPQSISLPLLALFEDHISADYRDLSEWSCVYVQHILHSNRACVEFLARRGIVQGEINIFGKGYSTSHESADALRADGYKLWEPDELYSYDAPFDDQIIGAVADTLELLSMRRRKLLLIDEGGIGIRALASSGAEFDVLSAVELTSRGAQYYPLISDTVPIVDVARSDLKKVEEAPHIARSMVAHVLGGGRRRAKIPHDAKFGLIGAGAIGQYLVSYLAEQGIPVAWHDHRIPGSTFPSSQALIDNCDVILSSTGEGIGLAGKVSEIRGAKIFGNCGSSDVEFQLHVLKRYTLDTAGCCFHVEIPARPWAGEVRFTSPTADLTFLNGGFPVNFDGTPDPISPRYIQLTRAGLMAGAVQASCSSRPGVHALRADWQRFLVAEFQHLSQFS
ncbi:MAG: hypothetical protein KKC29_08950 [Alphaproteobacteria bacterium]|jgi:hypothetical protein|nr:hypothetical protein [Alphaproteobacteria bacterium]MBU2041791.1 hypothetical protein [Alphaproteobacteria bacterium]MBU2126150.1 hypothetical protein [Alphaproteobacteria bacterium]MBU2291217.1 hypothetical protein [Alphaproteobacteria bacterium]